jgi:Helix-turn-helix domain
MRDRAITPPALARRLGVNVHRVLAWIKGGQLAAVNVGDGSRPRWRIMPDSLELFLASRSARPTPKVARRRKTAESITEYF